MPLHDYALIGDTYTAALVSRAGSMDWLCLPRFDSDACFAALLGGPEHGRWLLAPAATPQRSTRRYQGDSLVLQTEHHTSEGVVRVIDCMPPHGGHVDVLRRVEGISGRVTVHTELALRFGYGRSLPWLRADGKRIVAVAGPNTVVVDSTVPLRSEGGDLRGEFSVSAGESVDLRLAWTGPRQPQPGPLEVAASISDTRNWWQHWADMYRHPGLYRKEVVRSLVTLKALTYAPSGGIVAAPTTSLPELVGGVRNWDYRYCWIRDATYTLLTLLEAGYTAEAVAWRDWLLRAVAGAPDQMQIMYGIEGERRLTEVELGWLPGYADSRPVRIGNAASEQLQLDVYGELMDVLYQAHSSGIPADPDAWRVQRELLDFLESRWRDPDAGIWEIRGAPRHFTHSKVMAWVGADRAVKTVQRWGMEGPIDRWLQLRKDIFDDVCAHGYNAELGFFTQHYGSTVPDAALLQMAPVGFLPADDPRVVGTVKAIEEQLSHNGLIVRYPQTTELADVDGLPPGEGVFLACTFWLADNYLLRGDIKRGRELFERLAGLANDVGLLAEQYDPVKGQMVGNFPQALSHIALADTALNIIETTGPTPRRAGPSATG